MCNNTSAHAVPMCDVLPRNKNSIKYKFKKKKRKAKSLKKKLKEMSVSLGGGGLPVPKCVLFVCLFRRFEGGSAGSRPGRCWIKKSWKNLEDSSWRRTLIVQSLDHANAS